MISFARIHTADEFCYHSVRFLQILVGHYDPLQQVTQITVFYSIFETMADASEPAIQKQDAIGMGLRDHPN